MPPAFRRGDTFPAIILGEAQEYARTVRTFPQGERGNFVPFRIRLAARVGSDMEEIHTGMVKNRRQRPRLLGHIGLFGMCGQWKSEAARKLRSKGKTAHDFLHIGRLCL